MKPKQPPFLAQLLDLSPSELTPLWLEVSRAQATRRKPVELLAQMERDRFVTPSLIDQRQALDLDRAALDAATGFEALLLSPVAPLGVCSSLALTSQDRTISAVRGLEVISDPTNVMALECARRLKAEPGARVRLATVHQVVRAQPAPPGSGFTQHFRLFALAEAGSAEANDGFEVDALAGHVAVFDRLFDGLTKLGMSFPSRRVEILVTKEREVLADRLAARLEKALPHVEIARDALDQDYYDGVRLKSGAAAKSGDFVPIGDHGVFDWVGKLASDRRRRYVASGFGLQLAPALFG